MRRPVNGTISYRNTGNYRVRLAHLFLIFLFRICVQNFQRLPFYISSNGIRMTCSGCLGQFFPRLFQYANSYMLYMFIYTVKFCLLCSYSTFVYYIFLRQSEKKKKKEKIKYDMRLTLIHTRFTIVTKAVLEGNKF